MRTSSNLFSRLCDSDHLERAADLTVRGKRRRPDVAWFLFCRDAKIDRLQTELAAETYRPYGFELVRIRDPKPRLIARVPIIDRVVHTALVELLEPVFLPSLMPDAYACRKGFGTHRAVLRLLELMRRHRFALHLDIKSYFPSIDLEILRALIERRVRDRRFLAVIDQVLETGRGLYDSSLSRALASLTDDWPPPGHGLPIGAYTSQLFAAHVYLNELDHFMKRTLKVPGYVRYVDDLFIFGDRRADMRSWRTEVASWLHEQRSLRLKRPQARILSCRGHLDALGYRIRRDGVQALPRAFRRIGHRVRSALLPAGHCSQDMNLERSLAASAGVVLF